MGDEVYFDEGTAAAWGDDSVDFDTLTSQVYDDASRSADVLADTGSLPDDGSYDRVTERIARDAAEGRNIWNGLSEGGGTGLLRQAGNFLNQNRGLASLLAGGAAGLFNAQNARELLAAKLAGEAAADARKEAMQIAAEKRAEERKAADRKRYSDSITGMAPIHSGHQSALRTTSGNNVYDENGRMK